MENSQKGFRTRVLTVTALSTCITCVIGGVALSLLGHEELIVYAAVLGAGLAASLFFARRGQTDEAEALMMLFVGGTVGLGVGRQDTPEVAGAGVMLVIIILTLSTVMGDPKWDAFRLGALSLSWLLPLPLRWSTELFDASFVQRTCFELLLIPIAYVGARAVRQERNDRERALASRLAQIDTIVNSAQAIKTGDLSTRVEGDDDVSDVINQMTDGLETLARSMQNGAKEMTGVSAELAAMARQFDGGATQQSAALAETQATAQAFATAADEITSAATLVLDNARSTQRNHDAVAESIRALADLTNGIVALLEQIKDIANKSEVLALNAGLEGVRAGVDGVGFSIVATEMQRLAEMTARAAADASQLVADISTATQTTVMSLEDATRLVRDTTQAAERITTRSREQAHGVSQMVHAVSDVSSVSAELSGGAGDLVSTSDDVSRLATELSRRADAFVLSEDAAQGRSDSA